MEPPPIELLEVTGIDGIINWPESNVISHVQPESITLSWVGHKFKVEFVSGSDSYKFSSLDGVVNIPASTTAGAIDNHATLTVYVDDDEQFGGIIVFLPRVESEPFDDLHRAIDVDDGSIVKLGNNIYYAVTDFVDVSFASRVIYKGRMRNENYAKVYGYDEEKNPVRVLLFSNSEDTTEFTIDIGECHYIRACAQYRYDYNLSVYYRDRRKRN